LGREGKEQIGVESASSPRYQGHASAKKSGAVTSFSYGGSLSSRSESASSSVGMGGE
jgi:hypothetical protein